MKKVISFALILIILFACMHSTTYAEGEDREENTTNPELVSFEFIIIEDTETIPSRANTSLPFTNLLKNHAKRSSSTYYIVSGTDRLKVNSLTWSPSGQDISVAFINAQTGNTYAVGYSGGSIANSIIGTSTMPSGEYYVAIVNYDGPNAISGALSYSFI